MTLGARDRNCLLSVRIPWHLPTPVFSCAIRSAVQIETIDRLFANAGENQYGLPLICVKVSFIIKIFIECTINLVILLGNLHECVSFKVVESSVLKILLGFLYIGGSFAIIFSLKWKTVPIHFLSVTLLALYSFNETNKAILNGHFDYDEVKWHNNIKMNIPIIR